MISRTAEYALRAAVFLGQHRSHSHPVSRISDCTRIPGSYLSKILGALTRAGIVASRRGPRGGFALLRAPGDVSLLDVIRAVESGPPLAGCPLGRAEHAARMCPLHRVLSRARLRFEEELGRATLANLLLTTEGDCAFPRSRPRDLPRSLSSTPRLNRRASELHDLSREEERLE